MTPSTCVATTTNASAAPARSDCPYYPPQTVAVQPMVNRKSPDYAVLFYDSVSNRQFSAFCQEQLELESVTFLGKAFDYLIDRTRAIFGYFQKRTEFITPYHCIEEKEAVSREDKLFSRSMLYSTPVNQPVRVCHSLIPHLDYFDWIVRHLCYSKVRPVAHVYFQMRLLTIPWEKTDEEFHWKVRLIHPIDPLLKMYDLDVLYTAPFGLPVIEDAIEKFGYSNNTYIQLLFELNCPTLRHNLKMKNDDYQTKELKKFTFGKILASENCTVDYLELLETAACTGRSNFKKVEIVVKILFQQPIPFVH